MVAGYSFSFGYRAFALVHTGSPAWLWIALLPHDSENRDRASCQRLTLFVGDPSGSPFILAPAITYEACCVADVFWFGSTMQHTCCVLPHAMAWLFRVARGPFAREHTETLPWRYPTRSHWLCLGRWPTE
jgi:hypothetical protein